MLRLLVTLFFSLFHIKKISFEKIITFYCAVLVMLNICFWWAYVMKSAYCGLGCCYQKLNKKIIITALKGHFIVVAASSRMSSFILSYLQYCLVQGFCILNLLHASWLWCTNFYCMLHDCAYGFKNISQKQKQKDYLI